MTRAQSGPPQALNMLSLRELSEPPYRLLSHGRLRRACNAGQLHGHQRFDHAPWEVALEVAHAWKGGASYAEQKRVCGMCAHLATIPCGNRKGLYAVSGGGR
jgi:hypothetical protein